MRFTGSVIPQHSRTLWADALCINQKDDDERAAQVKLMGLIYFKAQRVRIWLGRDDVTEGDLSARVGIDLIKQYSQLYEACAPDSDGAKVSALSEQLFKDPIIADSLQWAVLRRLFKRPWFTRVWVVQELGLSRNATYYCGDSEFTRLELRGFRSVLLYSKTGKSILGSIDMQMIELGANFWRSAWSNERIELGEDPREAESFFDVLRTVQGLQCTEDKDMIYAFLGHPSSFKRQLLDVDPYFWYPRNYYEKRRTIVAPNYKKSYKFSQLCVDLAVTAVRDYDFGLQLLANISHDEASINMDFPSWIPRWDIQTPSPYFHGTAIYYEACKGFPSTSFSVEHRGKINKSPRLSLSALRLGKVWFVLRVLTAIPPEYIANTMAQLINDIPGWGEVSYITPPSSCTYPYDEEFLSALATTLSAGLTNGRNLSMKPADSYPDHHLNIFKAYYREQEAIEAGLEPEPSDEQDAEYFKDLFSGPCSHRVLFLSFEGRFGLGPSMTKFEDELWLPMGAKMPFVLRPTGRGTYKIVGQTFLYGVMRGEAVQGKGNEDFETVVLE